MVTKLRNIGANVIVHGQNWNEADSLAQQALAAEQGAYYIPPYGERERRREGGRVCERLASGVLTDKSSTELTSTSTHTHSLCPALPCPAQTTR